MKLTLETGELALPDDFSFTIKSNHPFFSDEGTASVPVTLPGSPENLSLLGHPDRISNAHRHIREFQAWLQGGVFQKKCRLISESAGIGTGISASLALSESEMYAEIQDRKLKDIFAALWWVSTRMFPANPYAAYIGEYRNGFVSMGGTEELFKAITVFPVASDKDDNIDVFVINKPLSDRLDDGPRPVNINGTVVNVPAGYGVAPFLYLWALIEYTFTLSGYTVGKNVFKTDIELKDIAVVHNCADTACAYGVFDGSSAYSWGFNCSDLVPNITVGDLIVFLRDTFGAFVTYKNGDISIQLIRDIINSNPDMDLSQYARTERNILYPEPRFVERSFDTSIESAEPAAETLVQLRSAHETLAQVSSESQLIGSGLFFIPPLGKYFYKQSSSSQATLSGSDCFMYSREFPEMESENISSKARFLPMISVDGRYMPYIGKRIHRYIDVDKDDEADQPIQICYAHFWEKKDINGSVVEGHFCGSPYSYYEDGALVQYRIWSGSISLPHQYAPLTPEGLAPYWSGYESLMINGAPEIEVTMDVPLEKFITMDRYSTKYIDGMKVLIKAMEYDIIDNGLLSVKMTLQTFPTYVDKLIPPAITFGTDYVWTIQSDRSIFAGNGYEILETDGLPDYTADDAPLEKPTVAGVTTKHRKRWLKYKYTEKWKTWLSWGHYSYTGIHQWNEYFLAEAQGS